MNKEDYKIAYENVMVANKMLQQENKQLKEKLKLYEEPDDMTLIFMWCEEKAKDKIKELQQRIDRAIKYLKQDGIYFEEERDELLEILGEKENE